MSGKTAGSALAAGVDAWLEQAREANAVEDAAQAADRRGGGLKGQQAAAAGNDPRCLNCTGAEGGQSTQP